MNAITLIISIRTDDFADYRRRLELRDVLDLQGVHTIIVDDGSPATVSNDIRAFCEPRGYEYLRLDTSEEPFSLSRARNAGIFAAATEWICFEDADLVYRSDFYQRLVRELEVLDETPFNFLTVPAVYLSAEQSARVFDNGTDAEYERALARALLEDPRGNPSNSSLQHYAPASSVIALRRKTALYAGAFDETFVGWGGEDRDFVLRLLIVNNRIQKPADFYETKPWNLNDTPDFSGWRALYRLHGDYLAKKGMYALHLFHEPQTWRTGGGNLKLAEERAAGYRSAPAKLHAKPDPNRAPDIVVGFNIHLANEQVLSALSNPEFIDEDTKIDADAYTRTILDKKPASVLMWNPYGTAWREQVYRALISGGITPIVAERGALPRALYFDKGGLCIESPSYEEQVWNKPLSDEEQAAIADYIYDLRFGDHALEKQSQRVGTSLVRQNLNIPADAKILFIPLQLSDDTVTTRFCEPGRTYLDFIDEIKRLSLALPHDWVIVYKNHPLSLMQIDFPSAICGDTAHVHDLLEASSAVSLYNSGVGVISMAFNKRVFYYGPCYYGFDGVNERFINAGKMVDRLASVEPVDEIKVQRFYHYLVNHLYSFADWHAEIAKVNGSSKRNKVKWIHFTSVKIPGYAPVKSQYPAIDFRRSVLFDPYRQHSMGNRSAAGPVTRFGTFAEAAAHFETAYEKDMSRPNLLRSAAEMHIRAGNKERAIVHLKLAAKQLPGNRKVRKRLLVVKYPFLKRVFGESEFPVNV
ncbi:glycosyltransferase [Sinorhizobium medicae]|uniref:glycosyltransferase n=1 Tax=Sinorhizobium medicae TaxID=110321 RepID=UPI000FDA541A|nr:glycosyltransferase [Sinorhizobium medicae]RVJ03376.1 glycosyltransferase [Sinorhizobium medicae]